MSSIEYRHLCGAAWLDGAEQPNLLAHSHGGRPSLFADIESCDFLLADWDAASGSTTWAISVGNKTMIMNQLLEEVVRIRGGKFVFLTPGQLAVMQTGQQLYDTVWDALPAAELGFGGEEQQAVSIVWDGTDARLQLSGAFGVVSIDLSVGGSVRRVEQCEYADVLVG